MDETADDETACDAPTTFQYDTSFPLDKLQRYFEYYKDANLKNRGRCRKCSKSYTRAQGSTTNMRDHLEVCDPAAFKILNQSKKRKIASNSSAPQ